MVKILEEFPGNSVGRPVSDYNWKEWFDGKPRLLERGQDYRCKDASMRAMVSNAAKHHLVACKTSIVKQGIAIQAYPLPHPPRVTDLNQENI